MNDKTIVGGIAVLILVAAGVLFMTTSGSAPKAASAPDGALALAQCMAEKGTTFYGAFWCPHCQKQKKLFGSAAKELPYVECSTADGKGQLQVCIDKGVKSYPTWEFGDGTRLTGELSFDTLREKSGCSLPGSAPVASSTDEHAGHDMTTTTPVAPSAI
jgi:thiol-disulfide isomerase/thioredoxin